jgi:hypothetical protein
VEKQAKGMIAGLAPASDQIKPALFPRKTAWHTFCRRNKA